MNKQPQDTKKTPKKSDIAQREEDILAFWNEKDIFKKTLDVTQDGEPFVFYDGPPFATGVPHYGHILPGTMKDVIPRYKTMRGKHVRRVWGWDCHGLPIENLIEKELELEDKKAIEEYGVEKFNEAARGSVMRYDSEWKETIPRLGRWIDMENSYRTMDATYTESVWWGFNELHKKGLVYEGYKSMHICPHCETTLSNNEVSEGYKDIKDLSVTAKFELVDEPGTFVLAWTTTPWTLPGNVALAVGPEIEYVIIEKKDEGVGDLVRFIVAKDRLEDIFGEQEFKLIETLKGSDLVGKAYKPLFDYYAKKAKLENHSNGWKIYSADFVTTEDGTSVVHIAPAFGEDDMNLGKEHNLPFVQHVHMDGSFKDEVTDFAGQKVKPKDDHQHTDIEIIKHLAHAGKLFHKEKYEHSYPHCWRCDTPLLNYATDSWFVKVSDIKKNLLKENAAIHWVPSAMKDGRFGNWLEGARDWAISRSRYWGAPLPVWRCRDCSIEQVASSFEDLKKWTPKSGNTYIVMRHGEAKSNVEHFVDSTPGATPDNHLTENGQKQVMESGGKLQDKKIDIIIASDFVRTKETAEIVAESIKYDPKKIIFDERIRETKTGTFHGKPTLEYHEFFEDSREMFVKRPPEGETLHEMKTRVADFLYDLEVKYSGKTILIVAHEYVMWCLLAASEGFDDMQAAGMMETPKTRFFENAQFSEIDFTPLSHNRDYELDVHVPFIDELALWCDCGERLERVPYVFDCWFESGSMPWAQVHYPFENEDLFKKMFPADFIAEGVDQTRGWFYNMLVLSTGIFDKTSFKNVVVNGVILAEDGQKMSKRLKNYPDLRLLIDKYGADALRLYLMSSPAVRAESLSLSEGGVAEVYRKVISRLLNVVSFYELFADRIESAVYKESGAVLDQWIVARTAELERAVRGGLDAYEFDRASRPIFDFIDDLSTWYVRRCRERIKGDNAEDAQRALGTLRFVLQRLSVIIAPIVPFTSEMVFKAVQSNDEPQSVHLSDWYEFDAPKKDILTTMANVRDVVSLALERRSAEGMKVRQPLASLTLKDTALKGEIELLEQIQSEVNVKAVLFDTSQKDEVTLDTTLTEALKQEGSARELMRRIQELRKKEGLRPDQNIILSVVTNSDGLNIVKEFKEEISTVVHAENISTSEGTGSGDGVSVDGITFWIDLGVV